ncbi:glycoside hydrolase family 57 protein [Desulfovibrio sp. ZJ369]|uniref:glycoside hydrolase family 57 protein n=1 Tax=Desulfovibrio sp. ZJ369 TaxID=2709793 RepID=UPI0013E9BC2B|nr:glycoside hydrolase family 57 protein [Desulfovibrio sp. ZJ369]
MPALCLCFEVHEPYRLRRYTVFDMGQNSIYEDDDRNCDALLYAARTCYLPMNDLLLKMIRRHSQDFKVALSISGTALDQFEQYAPEVLDGFKALADTGCVEFMAETAPHSLAFLYSREEFEIQVREQCARIKSLFGKKPVTFRHTEFVYNNDLAAALEKDGFKTVLAEGADHVLGWRSPNYVYRPVSAQKLRLLLRNSALSTDIGLRFSNRDWNEWPLTAEKFASWCHSLAGSAEIINIFNDYHVFGLRHNRDSGIFDFMEALPAAILGHKDFSFLTPEQVSRKIAPVGEVDVPDFMSWADEERDLTAWLGNDMQKDAIHALYGLTGRVRKLGAPDLLHDFQRLQTSDHFHYISTKWFAGYLPDRANPFGSPYDAYITYMNVLADFEMRLAAAEHAALNAAKPRSRAEAGTAGRKAAANAKSRPPAAEKAAKAEKKPANPGKKAAAKPKPSPGRKTAEGTAKPKAAPAKKAAGAAPKSALTLNGGKRKMS